MTPFADDLTVRVDALEANVAWMVDCGVDGIVATGTMGEAYSLTDDERRLVVETVVATVAGRVPVLVGISSDTPSRAAALAAMGEEVGAQGVMCTPPPTYAADPRELRAFYETVAASSDLPIMVYNNPSTTHTDLSPADVVALAAIDQVVAVKETSGDARRIFEILQLADGEIEVLVGGDDWALEGAAAGATGWISGCAVVVPELSVALFAAAAAGDLVAARGHYRRLAALARLDMDPKLVQFFKGALDAIGRYGGPVRPPRGGLQDRDVARLGAAMDALGAAAPGQDGAVAPLELAG